MSHMVDCQIEHLMESSKQNAKMIMDTITNKEDIYYKIDIAIWNVLLEEGLMPNPKFSTAESLIKMNEVINNKDNRVHFILKVLKHAFEREDREVKVTDELIAEREAERAAEEAAKKDPKE